MIIVLKPENVAQLVFFIRGEKVLLDADLAMLYGVEPRESGGGAKPETFPSGLRVSAFGKGVRRFDITDRDLRQR